MSTMIEVRDVPSPIGVFRVAAVGGRVCGVWAEDRWRGGDAPVTRRFPDAAFKTVKDPAGGASALRAYFDGEVTAIDALEVDVDGTPFQRDVWRALRDVPVGKTASYGELAAAAGHPRAVRAAGTATGSNRLGIVIPCHRIVRSTGDLGNYGGGIDRKRWLLDHEAKHTAGRGAVREASSGSPRTGRLRGARHPSRRGRG